MRIWAYKGIWNVTNGACVTVVTNSQSWGTTNHQAAGSTDIWHVINLTDRELIWEFDHQTNTLSRTK